MPYPLPLTRTEAYLAYKAGVIQQSDLKPSLAVPRNGIDAWLAYWTGLAADYPKRGDGTPHILQEEEAYIAYLCGVVNEYPEKCLRRVGAYLRYLISARWGRPDHPLNREELYLSLIKTQFIPSGDPSSDIVIDGTAKAPFVDVKMYGDTFQHSYEGKNCVGFPDQDERTINGLTFSVKDGIVTVNGTAAATTFTDSSTLFNFKEAGDITLSIEILGGTQSNSIIGFQNRDSQAVQLRWQQVYLSSTPVNKKAIDAETIAGTSDIRLYMNKDSVFNNFKFRLMAEYGSTATSFEPYVGGTPAPNPDYPQLIQTVTGRQVVKVEGKNLLSSVWEPGTYSTTNGGKQPLANTYRTAEKVAVQSDTTYIVSRDSAGLGINYYEYDANGNFLAYTLKSANQSITTGQTTKFITMSRSQTGGFEKMMLESGSTITAYEPYSSNAYEINLGKNLFDKDNVVKGIPQAADGSIGQTTGDGRTCEFIPVLPSTQYTHSGHPAGWAVIAFYRADKSFIQRVSDVSTITTPSDCAYASVSCSISNLGICQFELGSTATPYAPYFTPIELCKIGTYQDYIWKDGDDWKVHKATVSAIIDGSENWDTSGTNTFYVANIYSKIGNSIQSASTGEMYASHFTIADITSSNTLVGASLRVDSAHNVSNLRIRLQDMSGGVAGFIQMLSAKKPSIYARRLTPTDTTITDTNLIAQLDSLVNGGAENGTTYIKVSATDPNLPGLLYVEAPKYE